VAWIGTLKVDGTGKAWTWIVLGTAWCVFGTAVLRTYLQALGASTDSLSRLLRAGVVLHCVAALILPYSSNDLFSNLAYGRMSFLGMSPYTGGPGDLPAADPFRALVSSNWLRSSCAYGPILAGLNALAGRAATVLGAMAIFKLSMLAVMLATLLVAYAICRRHLSGERATRAFSLLALNPLLAYEITGEAHNDGVMILALTAFVWAALEERELLAVLFLALAFFAKFAVAPVLGLYLWFIARRDPLKGLAATALFATTGVLLFLPFAGAGIGYFQARDKT